MLTQFLLQLALITSGNSLVESFIDHCVDHYSEIEYKEYVSPPPKSLKNALALILNTPLGRKVYKTCREENLRLRFVKVSPKDAYWSDNYLDIYYSEDVSKWYQYKKSKMTIPAMSNLNVATLGSLITHEIGHTELGRKALGIPYIEKGARDDEAAPESDSTEIVIRLDRASLNAEEIRAVRLFENHYRRFYRMPLRHSYFKAYDVIKKRRYGL